MQILPPMIEPSSLHRAAALAAAGVVVALAGSTAAWSADAPNDFPTVDRVLYVQDCMKAHPGPYYEMVNKCSCAVDALAREVRYDEYVSMATIANAMTIGGERGNDIRDNETLKAPLKRYRELQEKVKKGCFVIR
jgi:hypothetical protein